jgi:WD40 repeat protein
MVGLGNGTVSLFDPQQNALGPLASSTGDTSNLTIMQTLDTTRVLFGFSDGPIKMFSLTSQAFTCTCTSSASLSGLAIMSSTLFAAAYTNGDVITWTDQCSMVESKSQSLPLASITYVPMSGVLAAGTTTGIVLMFNASANLSSVASVDIGSSVVLNCLQLYGDVILAAGASDGNVYYVRTDTMAYNNNMTLSTGNPVLALTLYSTASMTAACGNNIYLINLSTLALIQTLTGHTAAVKCLQFDATSGFLMSGGIDGNIKVWTASSGSLNATQSIGTPVYSLLLYNGSISTIAGTGTYTSNLLLILS